MIPLPGVDVWIGPLKVPPSAPSAWASVGHVAALVDTATVVVVLAGGAVVDDGEVVGRVVELVAGLVLPDPQPATTKPTKAHAASAACFFTPVNPDPERFSGKGNCQNHRTCSFHSLDPTSPERLVASRCVLTSEERHPERVG
jgi:hypothetical protein